ncbi:MAG: hypothetical protein ACR2RF_05985 [Geminicoccaceae bacterium]
MKTPEEIIDEECGTAYRNDERLEAAEIVQALDAAGYVIAPKEPTEEMVRSAIDAYMRAVPTTDVRTAWHETCRSMLTAAQKQETPPT